jgi:hypothetical protein
VINLLNFEFIVIYFLEDFLTTRRRTKATKTLNNSLRRLDVDGTKGVEGTKREGEGVT